MSWRRLNLTYIDSSQHIRRAARHDESEAPNRLAGWNLQERHPQHLSQLVQNMSPISHFDNAFRASARIDAQRSKEMVAMLVNAAVPLTSRDPLLAPPDANEQPQ